MKHILGIIICCIGFGSMAQELRFTSYFGFDEAFLSSEEIAKLDQFLQSNPNISVVRVEGYADPKGDVNYNFNLASERMNAVVQRLPNKNVPQNCIGENYPQKEEINHADMRKVDLIYTIVTQKEVQAVVAEEAPKPQSRFEELTKVNSTEEISIDLDVRFVGGQAVLLDESIADLESFYTFLSEHKGIKILIRGHVCCMDDYDLSVKRAKAIYTYLVKRGIDANSLDYKGYSNTMPKVQPEVTENDRKQNRRVDVVLLK